MDRMRRASLSPEEVWRKYDTMEEQLTVAVSERMLDLAGVGPGTRLYDVGSGRGDPAIRAAMRAAPDGSVLGIELHASVLAIARERALSAGVTNVRLRAGSAEEADWVEPAAFDAATARWSLMYMNAPDAALAHARRALRSGGVLVVASWVEPARVEWATFTRNVLARYRDLPPVEPHKPGPFRHAESVVLGCELERAGFAVEHEEELDVVVFEGTSADSIVAWCFDFGFARLAEELSDDAYGAFETALLREAERRAEDGRYRLRGVTRLTVARALHSS